MLVSLVLVVGSTPGWSETVRMGIYENAPLVFMDVQGEASGFFVDVMEEIARGSGWKMEYVAGTWSELEDWLHRGEIDVVPAIAYTSNYAEIIDFSRDSLITNWGQVYIQQGGNLASIIDLAGARVGLLKRDAHNKAFQGLMLQFGLEVFYKEYDSFREVFKALSEGAVDAGVVNRLFGQKYADGFGLEATSVLFNPIPLHFAVEKGDPKGLLPEIDRCVAELLENSGSIYQASLEQWIGALRQPRMPSWITRVFMGIGLFAFVFLVATVLLRMTVKRQNLVLMEKNQALEREIKERQQAEHALQLREEKYRLLAENTADVIWTMDAQQKYSYFSPSAERLYGYTPGELISLPLEKRLAPESLALVDRILVRRKELWDSGEVSLKPNRLELQQYRKNGELIWTEVVSTTVLDENGAPRGVVGVTREITDRKRAQQALGESERRFRQMVVKAPYPICIINSDDYELLQVNESFTNIFQYAPTDVDTADKWWSALFPDHHYREQVKGSLESAKRLSREADAEVEPQLWKVRRKDGQDREVESRLISMGDIDLIAMIDLTPHKELQAQLLLAKEHAEAASKAKSQFLADMSHDIRTPLNGIVGLLHLLKTTEQEQEQTQFLDMALQSCKYLTMLMGDILDLSRVEAGKLELQSAPFSVKAALNAVDQLFRPAFEQKGVELVFTLDSQVSMELKGDSSRLQQILHNLVGNALKFTESGEVCVECSVLPKPAPGKNRLLFSVTDTGMGIADDKLGKLFEPFSQVDSSYHTGKKGFGLGLSIVKRLVGLMGGNMCLVSEEGRGTAIYFTATFDASHRDVVEAKSGKAEQTEPGRPLEVLVAEDDRVSQLTMTRMLEKMGHRPHAVDDGRQALAALRDKRFDCVMMDIQMPFMDGVETTRRIRTDHEFAHVADIHIIAMTAYAMTGDKEGFFEAGVDDYLSKPVDVDVLRQVLERVKV